MDINIYQEYHRQLQVLENSINFNFFLPDITQIDQNLKYVWIIDNPVEKDREQNQYLSGRSRKVAMKAVKSFHIVQDFYKEVFIMSKSCVVADTQDKVKEFKKSYTDTFEFTQKIMVDLLQDIEITYNPKSIWLLENPGKSSELIFETFHYHLNELNKKQFFNDKLKLYSHFANNNFELELLRHFYNDNRDLFTLKSLDQLGKINYNKKTN